MAAPKALNVTPTSNGKKFDKTAINIKKRLERAEERSALCFFDDHKQMIAENYELLKYDPSIIPASHLNVHDNTPLKHNPFSDLKLR